MITFKDKPIDNLRVDDLCRPQRSENVYMARFFSVAGEDWTSTKRIPNVVYADSDNLLIHLVHNRTGHTLTANLSRLRKSWRLVVGANGEAK